MAAAWVNVTPEGTWQMRIDTGTDLQISYELTAVVLSPAAAAWLVRGVRPRHCEACGAVFVPMTPWGRYCSPRCRNRLQKQRQRAKAERRG